MGYRMDCFCGLCHARWIDWGYDHDIGPKGPCPACRARPVWLPKAEADRIESMRGECEGPRVEQVSGPADGGGGA